MARTFLMILKQHAEMQQTTDLSYIWSLILCDMIKKGLKVEEASSGWPETGLSSGPRQASGGQRHILYVFVEDTNVLLHEVNDPCGCTP